MIHTCTEHPLFFLFIFHLQVQCGTSVMRIRSSRSRKPVAKSWYAVVCDLIHCKCNSRCGRGDIAKAAHSPFAEHTSRDRLPSTYASLTPWMHFTPDVYQLVVRNRFVERLGVFFHRIRTSNPGLLQPFVRFVTPCLYLCLFDSTYSKPKSIEKCKKGRVRSVLVNGRCFL